MSKPETTKTAIEARARELCSAAGKDPNSYIPATIGKNGDMPVSGFIRGWECFRYKAEKEMEDV